MTTKDLDLKQYVLDKIPYSNNVFIESIIRIAKFINQDLNIGMFVPAVFENGKWEVLEEPSLIPSKKLLEYRKAKENVLFDGIFDIYSLDNIKNEYRIFKDNICIWTTIDSNDKKIEDLIKHEIPLTENAITRNIQKII